MKLFCSLTVVFVMLIASTASAQSSQRSMVIGDMVTRPNALLVLNPAGSDQGFLLPQLTTAERTSIRPSSPEEDGLVVFDISEKEFYYWKNNGWVKGLGEESVNEIPAQSGNSGKFLTTNGSAVSWGNAPQELPVQTGNAGKVLLTNGTTPSWTLLQGLPTQTGNNGKILTTDGANASWINQTQELPTQTGNNGKVLITNGTTASWSTEFPTQTGNAGKVLSTNGTAVSWINQAQELPTQTGNNGKILSTNGTSASWIAQTTGIPTQTGNSGKFLTTDGTNPSWVTVNGASVTLQSYSVDPSDFYGVADDKPDKHNEAMFDDNSTFMTIQKKGDGSMLMAPFHLPDGAVIQQVLFYYMDRDPQNFSVNIYRRPFAGSNDPIATTWNSSGNSASIQIQTITPTIGKETIDNSLYSYRIVVNLNPSGDANNSTEATHRVYGVQIKYMK